jgi:ferredoxin
MEKTTKLSKSAKSIIYYFSGTGNTAYAVSLIRKQLEADGHEVTVWPVTKEGLAPNENYDFQIFAFPILSWSAPAIMKRFIRKTHFPRDTKTAILAINGGIITKNGTLVKGYSGQAVEQVERLLKRKKLEVFLSGNASYPDNWTQATNPCNAKDSETIIRLGEAEVNAFVQKFLAEKHELFRCGSFNLTWSYVISGLFGLIGRRMLGKFFIADPHCTGCSICAKTCPVTNIRMVQKKPVWDAHCEDCNRCINVCPEKAIQVSVPLMVLHMAVNLGLTVWAIVAILAEVPKWIQLPEFLMICLEGLLIVAATLILVWISLVPIDKFFHIWMRFSGVRRFCSISYTNKFRRYTAPGFNPKKD